MQTFGAFFEDTFGDVYFPQYRPATQQRYEALVRQGLLAFFGKCPLDQIDFPLVRRYEAKVLNRGVKTRGHINLVRSVLRAAVDMRVLAKFPDVPSAKGPGKKLPRSPAREDVEQMVEHSCDWVRTALVLAFYQGLRSGELRALQARDIDFERGLVFVRRAFSENVLQDRPKDNDERVIPIAELARGQLLKAVRGLKPEDFVVLKPKRAHAHAASRVAGFSSGSGQGGPRPPLRRPRAATRLLHRARAQQRGRRDGARAGRPRGPAHDSALPALRGIRPAKSGLELRRQNCPVLRQKRVDLVSGRRIEARQDVS